MTKKKVILRAPLLTGCGYGTHARQIARWLFDLQDSSEFDLDVYCEALRWGGTFWYVNPDSHDGLIGRIIQNTKQSEHYDVSIQLQLPNEWNPFMADYNIGVTAGVETDRCNPEWIQHCNQMDMVIVPSEHAKAAFEKSGEITKPMVVIPESFIDACKVGALDIPQDSSVDELLDLSHITTDFNFLIFSQFCGDNPENDRKNISHTIRILAQEFADDKDVGIILKTNFGRNTKLDRLNVMNTVGKILTEINAGEFPRFYILHGDMTDYEVAALYRHSKVKALVSLTRGEGFGLPILEAAASGLPVMATNWSAHTEFLRSGKFMKIDYRLSPVHQSRIDNAIFLEGMMWAEADEQDVKRKARRFRESPKIPQEWAVALADTLQKTHSFEAISKLYTELLKEKLT